MEIFNLSLPATNRFASNYLKQSDDIQPFFHYRFEQSSADWDRVAELKNRTFPREKVAQHIEDFMEGFPSSEFVKKSIEKLKQPNSVVVIGGQQAGILTGPLYTLHKVISIIKLAEKKERELSIPVVPVFWIAGEDHDYQEVNHVFIPMEQRVDKWIYPEKMLQKKMVSNIELNKETCLSWAQNLIENFGETNHTNLLLDFVRNQIEKSKTFVDFFANIIMELFKDYGLLIVDSGNNSLRILEKEILVQQIHHHDSITNSLIEQQKQISKKGFPITIETNEQAANLFYYDHRFNERILLEFDRLTDHFVGKNGAISFTKDELVDIANNDPSKLSNNVVTRPLTQEWLFPTIAFIAGPGEISYWAELKLVFEHFGMKMPPIVPRLNITLVDRSIETDLNELNLQVADVLTRGTNVEREQFLESIKNKDVEELFLSTKEQLLAQYSLIEEKTNLLDKGLLPLLKKNETFLMKQIDFMEMKLEESTNRKHEVTLNKFDRIALSLRPDGFPQERIWNVFYYLNQYGPNLTKDLMELPYIFDGSHKIIKV
ncbi:bacillithiol biosynthesis cysteine-adding enzyme BshC [Neobacillus sp. PS3-40]|uniref:bacillithiol biosynthesis cysteine-adding enzyme BshC n=1 Tax=Neobacillus sp. PS3-40 TaxID=3070679 RepID=UPI0027DF63AF|nr:bacillithiol biosynthesis cysteine-adding enzyme BshC [Neobacillus sp. PS3-40]WML43605.1 bacillithiol biosynthesis cysteine-adding enzyme BshC [Neobacillus sp. PS3-40]